MISEERERYNIQLSDEEIQQMSRGRLKKLVSESVDSYAFSKMIMIAKRQTKCQSILKTIDENNVCIQKYLISSKLVKEEQVLLFTLRSYSFQVKSNYRYLHENNLACRACKQPDSVENEIHLCQTCEVFSEERGDTFLDFEDVFGPLEAQIKFIKRFKILARKWTLLLDIENEPS